MKVNALTIVYQGHGEPGIDYADDVIDEFRNIKSNKVHLRHDAVNHTVTAIVEPAPDLSLVIEILKTLNVKPVYNELRNVRLIEKTGHAGEYIVYLKATEGEPNLLL